MKLAFIDVTCTLSYGGIQTAVWELATTLQAMGHEVTVFGGAGGLRPDLPPQVQIRTFSFTPRARFLNLGSRFRKLAERVSFARQARAAVAEGDYDWVILTKPFDFIWPKLMPAGSRTRFAFMSGGTDFFRGDRWLGRGIGAWLACSHFNGWQIYQHYRRFPRVMFNGVDTERFNPAARDPALRAEWGLSDADVLFGFAGRVVGWKGLHLAIRALASSTLVAQPAQLLIVGQGAALGSLQALAEELGVSARVRFHAAVPHAELPRLYASCDAGIFPSIADEAFGITIAEAMSCGLPVVASYNGGIPEVVGNEGNCGLLFDNGDVSACARAMAALLADAGQRQAMGAQARQRIVTHFTWRQSAERLLAALADVEEKSAASP